MAKYTLQQAKEKAALKHDSMYDYSKWTSYASAQDTVTIICPIHGEFDQRLSNHFAGNGCSRCGTLSKSASLAKSTSQFVVDSKAVHGDKYDYSLWVDVSWHKKAPIICSAHGTFHQLVGSHIKGSGCTLCAGETRGVARRKEVVDWIELAKATHGDKYDYSEISSVKNNQSTIEIRCRIHDECFATTWNQHISMGVGCPACKLAHMHMKEIAKTGVKHHKQRHLGHNVMVLLDDPEWLTKQHQELGKSLAAIASDLGCDPVPVGKRFHHFGIKITATGISTGENQVAAFVDAILETECDRSDRTIISPLELDIYIPSHNLAIEYCGLYWHSEVHKIPSYHSDKLEACNKAGVRLITLFEDEWMQSEQLVKDKLTEILGKSTKPTVFARKCTIIELTREQKKEFFDANHIQGNGPGSITYGLVHNNAIIAAMTFISQANNQYTLNRFATSCNVPGGFSKLLSHFKRTCTWSTIVSFADRRWSEGGVYEKNGFVLDKILAPDYYYTDGKTRSHKFNFRHKNLPNVLGDQYDPTQSETENMAKSKYVRIYNCGLLRYVQTNSLPTYSKRSIGDPITWIHKN